MTNSSLAYDRSEERESVVIQMHVPCTDCSSSDGMTIYDDHTFCFVCESHNWTNDSKGSSYKPHKTMETTLTDKQVDAYNKARFKPLGDRGISSETCRRYGVKVTDKGSILMPYFDNDLQLTGYKVRTVDKQFRIVGTTGGRLFGQHLFTDGKYLTVLEGELDALAGYQLNGSRYAHVSIPNGSQSATRSFKDNLEFIEAFEQVVVNFDNDTAGIEASKKASEVVSPDKVKTLTLQKHKDACDYLKNSEHTEYVREWWDAKPFTMEGIVSLEDSWEHFIQRGQEETIPFPASFGTLNQMMNGGVALGELTVIGAYTSVGKSTFVSEIVYNLMMNTPKHIGCVFFESSIGETLENLLTIHLSKKIANVPYEDRDYDEYHKGYEDIMAKGNLHLYNYQGSSSTDKLFNKMRYLIKGKGCEVIIIDPLQAGVTSNDNKVIDDFMDRTLKLSKETNASIIIVSHLRKPSDANAHNVNEYDMKGSGSINQVAYNTILLSRDKMSDCEVTRNTTALKLVKCRRTGRTGTSGYLLYNEATGRLERGESPDIAVANQETEF